MKRKILVMILAFSVIGLQYSCRKSDANLDVDLSKYNSDNFVKGELDEWIMTNLTNPYNIELIYRFDRAMGDIAKNISPPNVDKVQPTAEMVLNCFLKPYEKIAGAAFIKKFTPKQFVFFGSTVYNSNGTETLGTADGGKRVILYNLNTLDVKQPENIRRRLRTIHHEFTHIVNQMVIIPPSFELVTPGDYVSDWTASVNTAEQALELGFVSRYARAEYTEDFAEMAAHLLVEGQIWFDNYVASAPNASAVEKLRKKEAIVVNYFKDAFNVDFRLLQQEVQRALKDTYGAVDPTDLSKTFASQLNNNKITSFQYNPTASHYAAYGDPAAIKAIFNNAQVAAKAQLLSSSLKWPNGVVTYFEYRFTDSQNMVFRIAFKETAASTTVYFADYYFKMTVNAVTGDTNFVKTTVSGAHYNGNGAYLTNAFEQYVLPYLTNRVFVAAWLPASITETSPLYKTFGGFYVKGATDNYVYGPIVLK